MRRIPVIVSAFGIVTGALASATPASADELAVRCPPGMVCAEAGTPSNTSPPVEPDGDGSGADGGSGGQVSRCGEFKTMGIYRDATTHENVDGPGPGVEQVNLVLCDSTANCPPGTSPYPGMVGEWCSGWFSPDAPPVVTVDDLMPGAYDDAVSQIPLPDASVISPGVEQGSLVNFGMWLAVPDVAPVTARAEAGAVWAQATATLMSTTFDMGNGDVVECEGTGEVLTPDSPSWGTDEASPSCGYTYEWPSAPQFTGTDDLAYHLMVTTLWEVRGTGSDGRDVAMTPVDVSYEFTYQVREVQTVGAP